MEAKEIGDLDHDRVIWEVVAVGHRLDVGVLEEDVDFLPDAPRFVEVPVEDLAVHHQDVEVHQEEQAGDDLGHVHDHLFEDRDLREGLVEEQLVQIEGTLRLQSQGHQLGEEDIPQHLRGPLHPQIK